MTARSSPKYSPARCPVCHEVMVVPAYARATPEYCVRCRADLRPLGPPPRVSRADGRRAPPAGVGEIAERIMALAAAPDLVPAAAERLVVEALEEMIAADLDREISDMAGRSAVTREGIVYALIRRLDDRAR